MAFDSKLEVRALWFGIAVFAAIGGAAVGSAQAQDGNAQSAGLFSSEEPLAFTLEMPYATVVGGRKKPEYVDGRLLYKGADGSDVAIDLKVRARGKSRVEACSFPPLRLNFPVKQVDGTWFAGQDKLKLVTHCSDAEAYQRYQALEYTAYKVLNLLTDMSFRVRPVEVTYYDTKKQRVVTVKPGFLIEDEERFAARHGLRAVEDERVDRGRYEPAALALVEMFQYFLGNTDWSATAGPAGEPCCHNLVPFAREDGTLVPIPYDFDSTGLVNPPYALPAAGLPIRDVRTRLYRGICRDAAELSASYEPFERQRAQITALFDSQRSRLGSTTDVVRRYIDDFYATIADPERAQKAFRVNCAR